MPATLPEGYTWRRATHADAEAIHGLVTRCNTEVIGHGDCTLDDIRTELADPDFALTTDTWLVHDAGGALTGYGWAQGKGTGEEVHTEVITADDEVIPWLFDRVEARAARIAAAGGHERYSIDKGVYREDTRMASAMAARGYTVQTVFHRMRIDHGPVVPAPVAPEGVTLHTGPGDEDFRRTAHAVLTESFKEHFGLPRTFDSWQRSLDQDSNFDWSMLTVAEYNGRPVALIVTGDGYVEDENCGYVHDIGVLAEARGRGIAKYLLKTAFAADARRGRAGTILHVDTNNVTPALGLYDSVGMRPVQVFDMWRQRKSR
jgi:mycothiol synthase